LNAYDRQQLPNKIVEQYSYGQSMEPPMQERRVPLEGAVNFRDLGGYPAAGGRMVRWRTIYRSDSLADLTDGDLLQLHALGIRTLCDFRLAGEAARKPNRLPGGNDIRQLSIGFLPTGTLEMLSSINSGEYGPADIEREVLIHYRKFVYDHGGEYRTLFNLLLDTTNLPLLMHCTSGKDRTGFGSAAVLAALGVPRDIIIADYALTNQYRRNIAHLFSGDMPADVIHVLTSANPRYIETALDEMDAAFGSPSGWLDSIGIDAPARVTLLRNLTE
jgi:protein-tyrosine phosphatase